MYRDLLERGIKSIPIDPGSPDGPRRMAIAMENLAYQPHWLNRSLMREGGRGEMASFFFSYTGAFLPETPRLFGRNIEFGFHAPAVPPSPGSRLIWSEMGKRIVLTHVYQTDAFDVEELHRLQTDVRREIEGDAFTANPYRLDAK